MSELKVDKVSPRSGNYVALNTVGMKNIIINGDMSIAQRGTSKTGFGNGDNGYYTCDRWFSGEGGTPTCEFTLTQDTDVPAGQGFAKSFKWDCTTAEDPISASSLIYMSQGIEGQNLQYLKKGTSSAESLTLSFWVKSNKTGTYIAELFDTDNSRQISKAYTIDASNTWEKKTLTFAGDTTGAFNNDNGGSLYLYFALAAGSNFTSGTLSTTWTSSTNANRYVGQVNLADNTANNFWITGVQLEAGTTASDFEFLPHDVNLQRCQRYFWKTYDIDDAPGSTNTGSRLGRFVDNTHNYASLQVPHVNLRANPTKTIYNPSTGATGQVITDGNVAKNAATENIDHHGGGWIYANNQSISTSASIQAHLTLEAEL